MRATSSGSSTANQISYTGVSVFSRRPTTEKSYRGFRLEAVGVLLAQQPDFADSDRDDTADTSGKGKTVEPKAKSSESNGQRIKPWVHVSGLKQLSRTFASCPLASESPQDGINENTSEGKEARAWFEARRTRRRGDVDAGDVDASKADDEPDGEYATEQWDDDLEEWFEAFQLGRDRSIPDVRSPAISAQATPALPLPPSIAVVAADNPLPQTSNLHPHPLLHLPSLLLTLGPSSLTIFRFLLARKRVLVLAKPPVEAVGVACWDLASLASVSRKDVNMWGVVTLHDIDSLKRPAAQAPQGGGWIACTTDTLFVEKTDCWDLLVDLTNINLPLLPSVFLLSSESPTELPPTATGDEDGRGRVRLYSPKATFETNGLRKSGSVGLSSVRFTWSDVKLVCVFVLAAF